MTDPEVPFDEPWQARAFALALAAVDGLGLEYEDFRQRLIAAIAEQPDAPYYDSWVAALESLLHAHGIEAETRGVRGESSPRAAQAHAEKAAAPRSESFPVEIADARSSS